MKLARHYAAAGVGLLLGMSTFVPAMASEGDVLDNEALLITSGDPGDPLYANAGDNLRTGVGSIFIQFSTTAPGGFLCTASVIGDHHVLTAAHCLRHNKPDGSPDVVTRLVIILPSGVNYFIDTNAGAGISYAVNPLYDAFVGSFGAFAPGDFAVLEVDQAFEADVERYELYRADDEFGQTTRHYGHGRSGTGNKGAVGGSDFFFARTGLNMYEQTLGAFFGPPFEQLLHDYDSGGLKHNAMDWWFSPGICGPENPDNPPWAQDGQCTTFRAGLFPDFKGYGKLEVGIAPGDSGGPGFIDGKIAGVHSFGFTHFCTGITNGTDFSCGLDSSYGEMSGDARVSAHVDWIDGVVAGDIPTTPVPEPLPAAAAATAEAAALGFEAPAIAKSFMANTFSRNLTEIVTLEQVKAQLGVE